MCNETSKPLVGHYRVLFNDTAEMQLKAEMIHARTMIRDIAPGTKTITDVARTLKPLTLAFPTLLLLLKLALTLPVGSYHRVISK